jgi:hypothetical protein
MNLILKKGSVIKDLTKKVRDSDMDKLRIKNKGGHTMASLKMT